MYVTNYGRISLWFSHLRAKKLKGFLRLKLPFICKWQTKPLRQKTPSCQLCFNWVCSESNNCTLNSAHFSRPWYWFFSFLSKLILKYKDFCKLEDHKWNSKTFPDLKKHLGPKCKCGTPLKAPYTNYKIPTTQSWYVCVCVIQFNVTFNVHSSEAFFHAHVGPHFSKQFERIFFFCQLDTY